MCADAATRAGGTEMASNGVLRGGGAAEAYSPGGRGGREPANLGDILERVLDRGLVIAGDIRVNLLDIELLTIKLRLIIASADTARQLGIDWWTTDPWLSSQGRDQASLEEENRELRDRVAELEDGSRPQLRQDRGQPRLEEGATGRPRRRDRGDSDERSGQRGARDRGDGHRGDGHRGAR
jgi:gas vesicle protein GvpA/GvpJ/GvpM family